MNQNRPREPVRMLLGGLTGLLFAGGCAALTLGMLSALSPSRPSPAYFVVSLAAFAGGPLLLGFGNRLGWARVLLAGLLSPIIALILAGLLFTSLGALERSASGWPFDLVPTVVSLYAAVLVAMAELLTCRSPRAQIAPILRSVGLALAIVLGFEWATHAVAALATGRPAGAAWATWTAIGLYAFLLGANASYWGSWQLRRETPVPTPATALFVSLNLLALVTVMVVRLAL